jgi:predicted Zn-dependent peptidase
MDISHIQHVQLEHTKNFFFSHYAPNNAILTLSGSIAPDKAYKLANKWFGPIPERSVPKRNLPDEPEQTAERRFEVRRNVPAHAIYKAWHVGPRDSNDYYTLDLLTDLLSGGESGRLYNRLVRGKNLFSEINIYLTADIEPGLIMLNAKLIKGTQISKAEEEVNNVIDELKQDRISSYEIEKVKNKFESTTVLSNTGILNKAINLSIFELLGDADFINKEVDQYRNVSSEMVKNAAAKYLSPVNCTTLYYLSQNDNV